MGFLMRRRGADVGINSVCTRTKAWRGHFIRLLCDMAARCRARIVTYVPFPVVPGASHNAGFVGVNSAAAVRPDTVSEWLIRFAIFNPAIA